jgi:peptidylprolyl isomerase
MASAKVVAVTIMTSAGLIALLIFWHQSASVEPSPSLLPSEVELAGPLTAEEQNIMNPAITNDMNPSATIRTNYGDITLELFANEMPITVGNFVTLAEDGFYDGTKFHRVIPNFMIQGGDPNTRGDNEAIYGTGGPESNIPDEFVEGELLTNTRGTIAMANTGQPNSGGSQWFINLVDNTGLDFDKQPLTSRHPVFGRVLSGMEVVDTIGGVSTKERDIPVEPVVIETISISAGAAPGSDDTAEAQVN